MAGHPRPTGRIVILLNSVVFTTGWSLCARRRRLSLLTLFLFSSSPNSPANDPEPQSASACQQGSRPSKANSTKQRASYFAFKNSSAFNLIRFTQLIVPQSVSKHTVRTSQANGVSFSSPEIPIDMSGRRCSGRITSQFVKT
ncbi:uncharacterized protein BO88DRAFT_158865 [Aspergillus vadensis CBS 113365]|uniref:Uncharacterized protein n=1 Tax=Aspergillus vadensis (strain CBS 113365 / IMI 142717 / IBT 24658) TaxID=1448311 RepID=A0A319AY06_ASPVC|nr:hypothetical protein BO88DRAFT_158865 [Aspergillus vadensis CBS 113365]PYH64655.1 hypothetical protein BO88DRAFT_158865 [Aspergillus vadensis CBS 113365]